MATSNEEILGRVEALLAQIVSCLPVTDTAPDWKKFIAFRWRRQASIFGSRGRLVGVAHPHVITFDDLKDIDDQKSRLDANTRQFVQGKSANNILLTGARGTGKSSLVKAALQRYAKDPGYKALKSVLDGGISATNNNLLIYATSNRRHLMPEKMSENLETRHTADGEIHPGETTEEKISLSERFGLWLSFYPFAQEEYLEIVDHWVHALAAAAANRDAMHKAALLWALERGSRSGRVAYQFARDWAGHHHAAKKAVARKSHRKVPHQQ